MTYYDMDTHQATIVATAGFLFILIVHVIIYIIDETSYLMELFFWVPGAVLNIICGSLSIVNYTENNERDNLETDSLAIGVTMLLCGLLMAVDSGLAYKNAATE